MKKHTVKSHMSTRVVHVRLGAPPASSSEPLPRKEVKGLDKLEENEKQWAERRSQFHAATGVTSLSKHIENEPDDAAESVTGLLDPDVHMLVDNNDITVQIPAASQRYSHRYMRFIEPSIPFRRHDPRTWKDRIIAREASWARIMEPMVNAYLVWRNADTQDIAPEAQREAAYFEVSVVYERALIPKYRIAQNPSEAAAVSLVRAGLLSCVPLSPSVAISLSLLDFYYRLRRHAPRLGVQQFVKALCDRHDLPYFSYLRDQFAQAFDVFLTIQREVKKRVDEALDRTGPDWRVKNSCPPCRYKLEDEPALVIPGFFAMDGNFSLKRSAAAGAADPRVFKSDYKISDDEINVYANEVKTRTRVTQVANALTSESIGIAVLEEPGEPGDDAPPTACTVRWKASKADHHKIAPDMFDQTGWYVAVCPHGHVLWYCEMRKSGELAKYPLGMCARIMDAGLAPLTGAADIGCALQGTLARSSIGERAKALGLQIRMNAFHGYGHNRLCQVVQHPLYLEGFGLEDLETAERLFSRSNHVASLVRHASHFHYEQFIDLFLACWDEEKYAALSTFICNNIIQARQLIDEFEPVLNEFKSARGLTDATIEGWRRDEQQYLESLKDEPAEDVLAMDYVEALQELQKLKDAAEDSRAELESGFIVMNARDMANASHATVAKRATKKKKTHAAYMAALANVESLERVLKIDVQWNPESVQYKATLEKIRLREYLRAVDRLEFLMLQRMFELAKTHAYGTGYKMREAIGKNIKARSKAIATAVKNYNQAARDLVPPAPQVDFATLMEWTELQEFDLLRLARRGDIRERDWAKPVNREAATKHYKIKRAYEELERRKIELRRLVTAIHDEEAELQRVAAALQREGHLLAPEVERMRRRRVAVNADHMARIAKLAKKPGLAAYVAACLVPGSREGSQPSGAVPCDASHTERPSPAAESQRDDASDEEFFGDDDLGEQVLAVQDFISLLEN